MKKALPVILLVVALMAALAIGVPFVISHFSKPGAKKTADIYLALLGKESYSTAGDMMTKAFKRRMNEEQLEIFARESGLNEFSSVEWARVQEKERRVDLDGVIKLNSGETIVVRATVLQEKDGDWLVETVLPKEQPKESEPASSP